MRKIIVFILVIYFASFCVDARAAPGLRSWWKTRIQNMRNRVNQTFQQIRNETTLVRHRVEEEIGLAANKAHSITQSVSRDVQEGTKKIKSSFDSQVDRFIREPSRKGLAAICSNPLTPLPEEALVKLCKDYWAEHGRPVAPPDDSPPPPAAWDPNPSDLDDPFPESRGFEPAKKAASRADPYYDPFRSYRSNATSGIDYSRYNETDWERLLNKIEAEQDSNKDTKDDALNAKDDAMAINVSTLAWGFITMCVIGLVAVGALLYHRAKTPSSIEYRATSS